MLPSLDTDCEACRADHFAMAMYACDGSGVLPAKLKFGEWLKCQAYKREVAW